VTENYFIGVHARELERLREQHAAWAPETHALWKRAGFAPGQHVADLGSGPGFTALDLARHVGPSGRVSAIDKASPFLEFLASEARRQGLDNIRTVEADLTNSRVIEGGFDGAFCRFLLAFLIADLDAVLRCIHESLKPGGTFAAMEYLTLRSATSSPPMRGFDSHTAAWVEYYRMNGADTSIGSYLPQRLAAAGFEVTHIDCVGGMAQPSHRWWTWWGRLVDDFGDKLAADGLMSGDEVRNLRSDWSAAGADPNAFIHTPILAQVVARKI
jgi:SAM-dependent methyltransferase